MRRFRKERRGQAAVESALIALVFLTMLLGIFDLGQILFIHQALVERARAAVRYGVVHSYDADAIRNVALYGQSVPTRTSGLFGLSAAMITVDRYDPGTNEERIIVTIANYPYRFFTPVIARAFTGRPITASLPVGAP